MAGPRTNLNDVLSKLGGGPVSATDSGPRKAPITSSGFHLAKAPLARAADNHSDPSKSGSYLHSIKLNSIASPQLLTPNSLVGSPVPAGSVKQPGSSSDSITHQGGSSKMPQSAVVPPASASNGGGYNAKLDSVPIEKLQAMIIKNQEEKMTLMEQREAMREQEDDLMGEDPEMIDMKITLLSKRLKELKGALAARNSNSAGTVSAPTSSNSTSADIVPTLYRTPPTSGPSRTLPKPMGQRATSTTLPSDDSDVPSRSFAGETRGMQTNPFLARHATPPSAFDDDLADAENIPPEQELIPPSSPGPTSPTPPRRRVTHTQVRAAAIEEFNDIPPEALLSSPPRATPPDRLPRAEPSSARSNLGGPGPSSSAARAARAQAVAEAEAQRSTIQVAPKYPWTKEVEKKLKEVFKLGSFRTHQKEAVDETMAGRDVFVLMPTGGGKSLTYQLPAICSTGKTRGVTFVISPLISLINDQSRHLCKLNIPAIAYTGDMTQSDKNLAHEQLGKFEPHTKVVYVTPEMMSMGGVIKRIMRDLVQRKRLARFVIDEAHCVSQWGHDFRSDYLKLGELRREYPSVPIMALTATAQTKVQGDIMHSLGITGCKVLKQSFNRPNLHYEVRPKQKNLLDDIVAFVNTQEKGASGIIYCASRDKCEETAKQLRDNHGIRAWHYHAGMPKGDRRKMQEGWQDHQFEIIVATIAFGMGIDKPDVRYVIHHSLPMSLEGYYQETGRAGRDGQYSVCVLYYTYGDSKNVTRMIERDKDLTHAQKERRKASLHEVLRYCDNKTDCRRSQVLAFFSETFDPVNCHGGCDVCLHKDKNIYTSEDVTPDALKIIKMVQSFDRDDRITITNAVDCFRGTNGNSGKGLAGNDYFGSGKHWDKREAERLVQTLLIEGALDEFFVVNNAGYNNAYLKLGKLSKQYLNGSRTLQMKFRQASPKKQAVSKKQPAKRKSVNGQAQISNFTQRVPNPISRQRSEQQIAAELAEFDNSPWGDTDEDYDPSKDREDPDDPIELSGTEGEDEDLPLAVVKRRRTESGGGRGNASLPALAMSAARAGTGAGSAVAPGAQAGVAVIDRSDTMSPVEECFKALLAMQKSVKRKHRLAPDLADETLQFIAATMPKNEKALQSVEGMTSKHIEIYGGLILAQCIKHSAKRDAAISRSALAASSGSRSKDSAAIRNIQGFAYNPSPNAPSHYSKVPPVKSRPLSARSFSNSPAAGTSGSASGNGIKGRPSPLFRPSSVVGGVPLTLGGGERVETAAAAGASGVKSVVVARPGKTAPRF